MSITSDDLSSGDIDLPSEDSCLDSDSDSGENESTDSPENSTKNSAWSWNQSTNNEIMLEPSLEETLRKRRQQGKVTENKQLSNESTWKSHSASAAAKEKKTTSRHAPTEVSSKRQDFYTRDKSLGSSGVNSEAALAVHRYKPRDPRMMATAAGNTETSDYDFLNDMMTQEIETLKRRIAARKMVGSKGRKARKKLNLNADTTSLEEDQLELKRLKEQLLQRQRSAAQKSAKVAVKQKMEQEVAEGKRGVYYLKRGERRKLELEATFDELRKRGGDKAVDKALAKRRKKNASKDHRHMPRPEEAYHQANTWN